MPLLPTLVSFLPFLSKPQRTFLRRFLLALGMNPGRATQLQLARLQGPSPRAQARWATCTFPFLRIALAFLQHQGILDHPLVAVLDASFLPKSGQKTWGKGRFWHGCQSRTTTGREVSVLGILDLQEETAWPLDVRQTPASLPEGTSRIDFYLQHLQEKATFFPASVKTLVVDAGYTHQRFVAGVQALGWHVVGKLRKDANLLYLYTGEREHRRGPARKWAGKVAVKTLDHFEEITSLQSGEEVRTQVVYHKGLQRVVWVVGVRTAPGPYTLLYSTDCAQSAQEIIRLYRLRFQIEFVFRDAKQFTGFGEDQVRSKEGQAMHHGMALLATLVVRLEERAAQKEVFSLRTRKQQMYNEAFILYVFSCQGIPATASVVQRVLEQARSFGCMAA